MKKSTVIFMCIAGIAAMMSGCGQQPVKQAGMSKDSSFDAPLYEWDESTGETLVIWGVYPEMERGYIQNAFQRYRDLTGNELETVQIPKEEYEERMLDAFINGGEAPDIVLSYGGTSIEAYDPDENFHDFSQAEWVDDLTDTSINQTVYNGRIIGLPHWEASVSGTLYNKKLFEKFKLEIPTTQKEFMEVCEKLKSHGITPLYMPGGEISMLLYQFPLDSVVENSEILNGLNDGSLSYAQLPEMRQIVNWYRTMAEKGYLGDTWKTDDWDGMSRALSGGKYAMMLCWDTWLYTDFQGNPEDFGLMPAFVGVPLEGTFEGPNLGLFIVNENSVRLEAALNFITFLADPYNYNAAFSGIYTAPVFKNQMDSISTPQYLEAERLIEKNYRDSTAWLRIRGFSQMDASCIIEFMESENGETAEECLQKMDRLRNARLKE